MKISRIVNNVEVDKNGCWIWQKSCNSAGYGQLTEKRVYWLAHRYAYACVNPDLDPKDIIRHQCHTPKCCNPDHLLVGSHKDNWHDSADAHKKASDSRRHSWEINGITYSTVREARASTGISMNSLIKFTENGVFNLKAYREACILSKCVPKV